MMKIQSVGESKMGKIWVLGDAVVDLIPEGKTLIYVVLAEPPRMWQ